MSAQLNAYFSYATFNTPNNQPYLETYLTLVGTSLKPKTDNHNSHNSVNIVLTISKDSVLIKANKYNLKGPIYADSLFPLSFIDNQRYHLSNGHYELKMTISDNYDALKKPLVVTSSVDIDYSASELQSSSLQILESYKRTATPGSLTKSGFDLIPYTVNYFPETSNELAFYMETYNANKILGNERPFIYNYYLENSDNQHVMSSYGSFRKQNAQDVNPLLAKMDISKLGSGNYNLVVEIKDEKNTLRLQKKYFFQRMNRNVDIVTLQNQSEVNELYPYFGNCNNLDTLKMLVECLWPIADAVDKERVINQSLTKNPDQMKKFVVDFWRRRAADTANPLKMWGTYYREVQKVMVLFKCGKQKGYYTDRGRVYLQYGAPNQRSQQLNEPNTYPYEIWQYYRTTNAVNGAFFSNRKFVFVSHNLGDDCFNLVHSDMSGEVNNPRWQFEVTRRNNNGIANPDNTTPSGTENNQFNEIYSNPR
ncbi:MAG: GWxTD domain-containing protein [Bacteroidia bacterium]|nr:GWxTD domain-containing protein [Bacteroidia bacterium]